MNFALYYIEDAYSTAKKIMGRQSAGKALMKGAVRTWPEGIIHAYGPGDSHPHSLVEQLRSHGYVGTLRWHGGVGRGSIEGLGALYFPAPLTKELAYTRNARNPASYSLFGVTHTICSAGAMDQIADMVAAPFQPWDALICTSTAALEVVGRLHEGMKAWMQEHFGATRFNTPMLPVIPLGVHAGDYGRSEREREEARHHLAILSDEVVVLFAGRLSFHAKTNPVQSYLALEQVARETGKKLLCLEAGIYPNKGIRKGYEEARALLAPSVRFLHVDGSDENRYRMTWQAADIFLSLSDNIQETFGLTPLEAMAAGLPVVVSDWNGYKDTVRDGIDGYRIPVVMAPSGSGENLAYRHALGVDPYDFFVGRVSLATALDTTVLRDRLKNLVEDSGLRQSIGCQAAERIRSRYDWPVILRRYAGLADEMGHIRRKSGKLQPRMWPNRPDPFSLFAHYGTVSLSSEMVVHTTGCSKKAVGELLGLSMLNYGMHTTLLPAEEIVALYEIALKEPISVGRLLQVAGGSSPVRIRSLLWLCKAGLLVIDDVCKVGGQRP